MAHNVSTATPQAVYGNVLSPRAGYSDGPEVLDAPPLQHHHAQNDYIRSYAAPITAKKHIMGLRRPTFGLLIILLVVVIVAAVGGGVGGALAVQNAKSKVDSASRPTAFVTLSAPSLSSGTNSPTSTGAVTGAVYTPVLPNNVVRVGISCPGGDLNATILGNQGGTYSCTMGTNYIGNDIIGTVAYTLQQCAEACSWYNVAQATTGVAKCRGAVLYEMLGKYYNERRANCFLKTNMDNGLACNDCTMLTPI